MNVAVFGMDPGGHTGLAWGVFDTASGVEHALEHRMEPFGSVTFEGDEYQQIRDVCDQWQKFLKECVRQRCIPADQVRFCAEDFVPWGGGGAGKEGISPVRILWGVIGYRMGQVAEFRRTHRTSQLMAPPITLQLASQAKPKTANPMLRRAGVWVPGDDHQQSAWRHVALYLGNYQKARLTIARS